MDSHFDFQSSTIEESVGRMLPQIDAAARLANGPVLNSAESETLPW
jgi:hypothetical protein